ncbi:DUF397 domain-containing protein [Streptomyces albipurpureus]|uniref:DUF397 domain-containing protein n=1 Tax=Streptomyces albipurpureus TaxID=2897419 RepID=A0ABT0UVV2_9ACTN|nr:DUF397 domain-containing protein [Streptomyces sp. CWNU-1]MCM2391765.1 DUF397 domain-containing protein [Streptomyces sp. CWNU-1]
MIIRSDLSWTKSSYSDGGNNCVEVAHGGSGVMPVRDSKRPDPVIVVGGHTWTAFVSGVKSGDVA